MLAISCYDQDATPSSSPSFSIRCRTEGNLSNATPTGRIVMKGVVTQDVVSNGKILIGAGSKVSGIGHVDPDSGRIEAKGDWSIVTENQEIQVHGEAQDTAGGFHGIPGQETSFENQLSQRQAVVRDGRYCFLEDKTPFVLSTFADLQPYLTAMGVPVTAENQLLAGTGRTITNYGTYATGVTIDKHVDLTHISADMQPIVQMITFADGGATT